MKRFLKKDPYAWIKDRKGEDMLAVLSVHRGIVNKYYVFFPYSFKFFKPPLSDCGSFIMQKNKLT